MQTDANPRKLRSEISSAFSNARFHNEQEGGKFEYATATVPKLDTGDIKKLNTLNEELGVNTEITRSGTSVTVKLF